jgi:hypothetical protein
MTTYNVLIKNRTMSDNIDSLNRSAICSGSDLGDGSVFALDSLSTTSGENEIWKATVPNVLGGAGSGLWMSAARGVNTLLSGTYAYRGLNDDPRNFYTISGSVLDAFKPQAGDVITMTAAGISGSPSTGLYVVPAEGVFAMAWSATGPTSGSIMVWKEIEETYVSIGSGAIGTHRVLAYRLVCLAN